MKMKIKSPKTYSRNENKKRLKTSIFFIVFQMASEIVCGRPVTHLATHL